MFRKRIGDQSESKIDSDKIPAKKDRARFAGPLRGAVGLNALLNTVAFLQKTLLSSTLSFCLLNTELTYERAFCRL